MTIKDFLVNYDIEGHARRLVSRNGECHGEGCTCDECFISTVFKSKNIGIDCTPQEALSKAALLLLVLPNTHPETIEHKVKSIW